MFKHEKLEALNHNPRVGGSSPSPDTKFLNKFNRLCEFQIFADLLANVQNLLPDTRIISGLY